MTVGLVGSGVSPVSFQTGSDTARASFALPLHSIGLHAQTLRVAVIGRNLAIWADAPNIDPEFVLSTAPSRGMELGQLPTARSVGVQISLTP